MRSFAMSGASGRTLWQPTSKAGWTTSATGRHAGTVARQSPPRPMVAGPSATSHASDWPAMQRTRRRGRGHALSADRAFSPAGRIKPAAAWPVPASAGAWTRREPARAAAPRLPARFPSNASAGSNARPTPGGEESGRSTRPAPRCGWPTNTTRRRSGARWRHASTTPARWGMLAPTTCPPPPPPTLAFAATKSTKPAPSRAGGREAQQDDRRLCGPAGRGEGTAERIAWSPQKRCGINSTSLWRRRGSPHGSASPENPRHPRQGRRAVPPGVQPVPPVFPSPKKEKPRGANLGAKSL